MHEKQAEIIAIRAVEWICSDRRRFADFARLTGATPDDARNMLEDSEFLSSALDFLLLYDRRVQEFCRVARLSPETPMQARQALPGGDLPNWT